LWVGTDLQSEDNVSKVFFFLIYKGKNITEQLIALKAEKRCDSQFQTEYSL